MSTASRDAEFTEYVTARLTWLRRVAYLLCQDWQRADDLEQSAITKLYVHWSRARAAEHIDAYARVVLVRQFLSEERAGWARRVSLPGELPEQPGHVADADAVLDVREALAGLPDRQRARLVLRFYCDMSVDQAADALGCTAGTIKSQTARGLATMRRAPEPARPDRLEVPGHA